MLTLNKNENLFNQLSTIYAAAVDDSIQNQIQIKSLSDTKLLQSPQYSQSLNMHYKSYNIYRGDAELQYPIAEIMPGKRRSQNTHNVYTVLLSYLLPSWKQYPKRSESFICTNNMDKAAVYGDYDDNSVYYVFPENDVKIGVCPERDIWLSFPVLLHDYEVSNMREFNEYFIDLLKAYSKLTYEEIYNMFKTENIQQIKELFNIVEHNIRSHILCDYKISLYPYLIEKLTAHIENDNNATLISILDDVLNPTKNGFMLLNNMNELSKVNATKPHEMWFSGKCIMISAIAMYE